uniref:Uncharacterized protein n=2 Tax=Sphaerodactylus townsendi TaxID=933632 RepID=A0ACB8ENK9_9SAUR
MRCCLPVANRRQTTGSLSPKRFQSALTVQAGERSSPKKVKLGLQSPSRKAARTKASPLLFHPANSPYSSTPKGAARKGHRVTAWLGHPSPLKGASKKTMEDLAPLSENSHLGQDQVCCAAPAPKTTKEGGQGDRERVRSRKVQLVRKQLISRADFPLGEARSPSARVLNSGRGFAEQCAEAWMRLPSQQKDRERHLRFYHQQFQQPPILQEKLNYQPLERFLAQYKPQEVRVQPEAPGRPPSPLQGSDETMQLEDLDDSDFSEDSFSPGPSQRKPEADGGREGSQLSFFLHRREREADGQEVQLGQELFFELPDLESKEGASPRTEEAVGSEQSARSQSDWSTGEASMFDFPPQNDTAEKPYCLQGDGVEGSRSSAEDPLAGRSLLRCVHCDLGCPEDSFSGSEKATQILPFAHASGSASCLAPGRREGSVKGCPVNSEKQLPKASNLSGSLAFSLDFVAGTRAPLTGQLLDAERADVVEKDALDQQPGKTRLEEEREGKGPSSPRTRVDENARLSLGKKAAPLPPLHETDPWGRRAVQPLPPQGKPQWLPQPHRSPKPPASLGDVSSVGELRDCSCSFSVGSTGLAEILSPWKGKDGPLPLGSLQAGEVSADAIALSSSPEPFHSGEKGCSESLVPPKHPGLPEKAFVSRAAENQGPSGQSLPLQLSLEVQKPELGCSQEQVKLVFPSEETRPPKKQSAPQASVRKSSDAAKQGSGSNVGSPWSSPDDDCKSSLGSKEALGRQAAIQIRQEQLDEMAALSRQEEGLVRQMSDLDLENFVMKLDGLFLLKLKCIQRTRTQLQPLLAAEQRMSPN